jgi:hypothetical protein
MEVSKRQEIMVILSFCNGGEMFESIIREQSLNFGV